MTSPECNGGAPAGCATEDGRLWFATTKGVVTTTPTALSRPVAPAAVIEDFAVDGRRYSEGPIALPAGSERLEFRFTAPYLAAPDRVRFRYRLEGYDREWVEGRTDRTATYTHLPPGDYRFVVAAGLSTGGREGAPASTSFTLAPHFWQTDLFLLAVAVGLVLGGAGFNWLRARRLRRRASELARVVDERTRELADANEELRRVSLTDPLTGLANRRHFDDTLALESARTLRTGRPLSLIVMDVDHFKAFNDAYGHQGGDECLRRVAGAVATHAQRPGDVAARYGGEEFAIILPDTGADGAGVVAEAMRRSVEALAVEHAGSTTARSVTISLGLATAGLGGEVAPERLVAAADEALYAAKNGGRNRVVRAQPPPDAEPPVRGKQ